jgi:hypothetical protein
MVTGVGPGQPIGPIQQPQDPKAAFKLILEILLKAPATDADKAAKIMEAAREMVSSFNGDAIAAVQEFGQELQQSADQASLRDEIGKAARAAIPKNDRDEAVLSAACFYLTGSIR